MTPTQETIFAIDNLGKLVGRIGQLCGDSRRNKMDLRAVCIGGNHDRLLKRQPAAGRTGHSYASIIYHALSHQHKNCQWVIPNAAESIVKSFGFDIRNIHGDDISTGNAQGGPLATFTRNVVKMQAHRNCAVTNMGHFQQFLTLHTPGIVVNNALCGFDAYAKNKLHAVPSPPAQVAYLIDERDGLTMPRQIRVYDSEQRKRDAAAR